MSVRHTNSLSYHLFVFSVQFYSIPYLDKYIGETANTGYTRGDEHLDDLRHGRDRCRAYRHMMEKHNGVRPNFQMNVTGVYGKDTMLRQISEAMPIQKN